MGHGGILPDELLVRIFSLIPTDSRSNRGGYSDKLLPLMRVSRLWKETILGSPILWRRIRVVFQDSSTLSHLVDEEEDEDSELLESDSADSYVYTPTQKQILDRTAFYISASANMPLALDVHISDVHISASPARRFLREISMMLLGEAARWQSANLDLPYRQSMVTRLLKTVKFPMLSSLCFAAHTRTFPLDHLSFPALAHLTVTYGHQDDFNNLRPIVNQLKTCFFNDCSFPAALSLLKTSPSTVHIVLLIQGRVNRIREEPSQWGLETIDTSVEELTIALLGPTEHSPSFANFTAKARSLRKLVVVLPFCLLHATPLLGFLDRSECCLKVLHLQILMPSSENLVGTLGTILRSCALQLIEEFQLSVETVSATALVKQLTLHHATMIPQVRRIVLSGFRFVSGLAIQELHDCGRPLAEFLIGSTTMIWPALPPETSLKKLLRFGDNWAFKTKNVPKHTYADPSASKTPFLNSLNAPDTPDRHDLWEEIYRY
ncbi:hypothetical protein MIND_01357400 [Mycena indigotica]|uniref:F-box domain-containing protein n=1 Tax=Mycena indigotica TaxID=2126181 RepID=A0A8H6VRZ1_9AGAR|nr:uncharacterized protein MIND_01357400 [Mycena indigotica]KAF7289831.1 hypothetical protein MIND_01357400 [Mycena indigotica]